MTAVAASIRSPAPPRRAFALCLTLLVVLTTAGCQSPSARPLGESEPVQSGTSRLVWSVAKLEGSRLAVELFRSEDGVHVEEVGRWTAAPSRAQAGLALSESASGPPLTDPQDPRDVPRLWGALKERSAATGDLISTSNALGPALWRRATIGTSTCVLVVQRWVAGASAAAPTTNLSGYYCHPPAQPLTAGEAETIVRSIGLLPPSSP